MAMERIYVTTPQIVLKGAHQGENLARCVCFPIDGLKEQYGEGTWTIAFRRPFETDSYVVANQEEVGDYAVWGMDLTDTAIAGEGRVELRYYVDDTICKTDVYAVLILPSLGETGDAPSPYEDIIDTVAGYVNEAKEAVETVPETVAEMQAQLDEAISGVTVDSEVINARVGADATTYSTLKQRLDTENTELKNGIGEIRNDIYTISSNLIDFSSFNADKWKNGWYGHPDYLYGIYYDEMIPVEGGKTIYASYQNFDSSVYGPNYRIRIFQYASDKSPIAVDWSSSSMVTRTDIPASAVLNANTRYIVVVFSTDNKSYQINTEMVLSLNPKMYVGFDFVPTNNIYPKYIPEWQHEKNLDTYKNGYRYLIPTFKYLSGMVLLGTDDLRHFNLVKRAGSYIPQNTIEVDDPENAGNRITVTNSFRDGAIIKIGDYYYLLYTICNFYVGNTSIGMCRTKDFTVFEELPNLIVTVDDIDADKIAECSWAPDWYRDGDDYYIVTTVRVVGPQNSYAGYWTVVSKYDVDNHTIGAGTSILKNQGIDYHIWHENGYYYAVGGSYRIWKSSTLLGTYSAVETNLGSAERTTRTYEAHYLVKMDNGKWRLFRQEVKNSLGNTAHMTYCDADSIEGIWSADHYITLSSEAEEYAAQVHGEPNMEWCHFTFYDFKQGNNNNIYFTT